MVKETVHIIEKSTEEAESKSSQPAETKPIDTAPEVSTDSLTIQETVNAKDKIELDIKK